LPQAESQNQKLRGPIPQCRPYPGLGGHVRLPHPGLHEIPSQDGTLDFKDTPPDDPEFFQRMDLMKWLEPDTRPTHQPDNPRLCLL